MQALKDDEDLVLVLGRDADAIVGYSKKPGCVLFFRGNSDGGHFFAAKFNGVADQVLEELHQLARVDSDRWKVVMGNDCATFFDGAAQVF
jgi:hypothetical protein